MKKNSIHTVIKGKRGRTCLFLITPIFLIMLLFASCEVEFSPNAAWKEVPVLYCVLDQDDDTTWVRVEKCFLGEGSMYQYGSISDSLNYPQGSISVKLCAYQNGQCVDIETCNYTVRDRAEGVFANRAQPLYYSTKPLNENYMYKLVVTRVADGTVLAYTDSIPLILQTSEVLIRKPSNMDRFGFYARTGTTPVCYIEWNVMENARLYQPIVRFYYTYPEIGDTHYVDLRCNKVAVSNDVSVLPCYYPRDAFLSEMYTKLKDDPNSKRSLNKVDLYLTACSEDLNAYISSIDIAGGVDQGSETYTNIYNGVGVFASRRTHLYKSLRADSTFISGSSYGLIWYLKSLDVGF